MPTATDICPFGTLDELSAKKNFLGKTREQAAELFFEHPTYYGEDLMWMGDAAFCYYLPAVLPYIESEESQGDSEFICALISALEFRQEDSPQALRACREPLLHLLHYMNAHWEKFDIGLPEDIFYQDLPARATHLLATVETQR